LLTGCAFPRYSKAGVGVTHRHCEPTGRANARPMTGSAKQSMAPQFDMDCFVAAFLAMTRNAPVQGWVERSDTHHVPNGADLPPMANQIRAFGLRQVDPTGKSAESCPAPLRKIFSFSFYPNQLHIRRCLVPPEGRSRVVTSAGRDAVDAAASGDVRGWQGGSTRPVS